MHQMRILQAVSIVTFKEWFAYRFHSMISILVRPLFFLVQYTIWTAVYAGHSTVAGLTLDEMIMYCGVSALIGYLIMDSADWNLQMLISTGKFLTFALRPVHHVFFALCQKIGHRFLGLLFEFLPVIAIFSFVFKIPLIPYSIFWSVISVALSFLMHFYIRYIIGLAGFWFVKIEGLRRTLRIVIDFTSGALLPLTLFPLAMQKVLFFLPFQFITYVPCMVFKGEYNLGSINLSVPEIVGIQALWVLGIIFITELIYRSAIKRFSGVGA